MLQTLEVDRGDKTFSTSSNLGGAGYECNQAMFFLVQTLEVDRGDKTFSTSSNLGGGGTDVIRQCLLVSDTGGGPWRQDLLHLL